MSTTDLGVVGRDVLSFTVHGPWAHFRRIDTTTEKLTYRVIPRTTVAGLLAAVLGEPRDSYYDTFAQDSSAIAISPACALETQSIPQLTLPTESGDIMTAKGVSGKTVIDPKTIAKERKRRTFEYVVDPSYRIDLVLNDADTFERLSTYLERGRSTYTPSLGKTECLATITDVTQSTVKEGGNPESISSTVPEEYIVPTAGESLRMERTPAYMQANNDGRKTKGYISYAFTPEEQTLTAPAAPVRSVEKRSVCFI